MNQHIEDGLEKLNTVLPLYERQRTLPPDRIEAHRAILSELAHTGALPDREYLADILGDADEKLAELAKLDLVVLKDGNLVGAYPITVEPTVHNVSVFGHRIHAMCALDALSVAPLFQTRTRIQSRCAVSGEAIEIEQDRETILSAMPTAPWVGIRWQQTCGHAAHSLCMEMVFLKDANTASDWQAADPPSHSLYSLDEAVAFGQRFFVPLLRPQ